MYLLPTISVYRQKKKTTHTNCWNSLLNGLDNVMKQNEREKKKAWLSREKSLKFDKPKCFSVILGFFNYFSFENGDQWCTYTS